jgi:WD40 repeat protein
LALLALPALAQTPPTYDDDIKPLIQRRCLPCHSSSEMRASLNLETYQGVMKGGGSGDVVKPGRASASMLYKVLAREEGVPQMPLGGAKLPDADINKIREWIQGGLLENARSKPQGPAVQSLDFKPTSLNKPAEAAMPAALAALNLPEPARPHPVTALAASPWAPLLAVAGHERIYLYNLSTRAMLGELAFPEGIPYVLRFSRDGNTLLAAGGRGVQLGEVILFDVKTGKRTATVGHEMDIVLAADLSPDGKLVALGGPGKVVKVFSVADGKQLYEIKRHTDWITALEFSPDGAKLATGDRAGGIYLWESHNGGILLNLAEHKDSVTSLSWRGDGVLLASGGEDGELVVWNVQDGFPVATDAKAHIPKSKGVVYGKPPSGVLSVEYMNDGRLVTIGRDKCIHLWTTDGKPVSATQPADALLTKVTASWDSKLLIAGDYLGNLTLWDGKQTTMLKSPTLLSKAQ